MIEYQGNLKVKYKHTQFTAQWLSIQPIELPNEYPTYNQDQA